MHFSATAKVWIGIVLGIILLQILLWYLLHTTGYRTEGPGGTIGMASAVAATWPRRKGR